MLAVQSVALPTTTPKSSRTFSAMDTFFSIEIYGNGYYESIFDKCQKRVRELERMGNIFDKTSELGRINSISTSSKTPTISIIASKELMTIFSKSREAYFSSEGAFDISVKPLIDYYGIKGPSSNMTFEQAQKLVGLGRVNMITSNNTIIFPRGMQFDLGGILKGYAVDEVVVVLKKYRIENALINGGGNIYGMGKSADNKPWIIGIRDPNNKDRIIKKVTLSDNAVATSAGYERNFMYHGKKYSHIIDPRSGLPVEAIGSVTVIAPSATVADIFSTTGFIERNLKVKGIEFYYF